MTTARRFEALAEDGSWVPVRLEALRRWQVFRLFEADGTPVRYMDAPDGCPIFVAIEATQRLCADEGIQTHVEAVPIRGSLHVGQTEVQMEVDRETVPTAEVTRVAAWQADLAQLTGDQARRDALAAEIVDAHGVLNAWSLTPFRRLADRIKDALRIRDDSVSGWHEKLDQAATAECTCGGGATEDAERCVACRIYQRITGRPRG